jgi:hypothetical protein
VLRVWQRAGSVSSSRGSPGAVEEIASATPSARQVALFRPTSCRDLRQFPVVRVRHQRQHIRARINDIIDILADLNLHSVKDGRTCVPANRLKSQRWIWH